MIEDCGSEHVGTHLRTVCIQCNAEVLRNQTKYYKATVNKKDAAGTRQHL